MSVHGHGRTITKAAITLTQLLLRKQARLCGDRIAARGSDVEPCSSMCCVGVRLQGHAIGSYSLMQTAEAKNVESGSISSTGEGCGKTVLHIL